MDRAGEGVYRPYFRIFRSIKECYLGQLLESLVNALKDRQIRISAGLEDTGDFLGEFQVAVDFADDSVSIHSEDN